MAKNSDRPEGLEQLKTDLKYGQPAGLYLFHGEEHFLRDHYLTMLKKKLLDGPAAEFNFHRFTQENMDLEGLARAVEALPMMAERSLIQVDDYDLSILNEGEREKLVEILSDIPDYCTLVFVFGTVELKFDGRQKKLKEALEKGVNVEFCRQSQRELNNWIRRHFRAHEKDIEEPECEYLVFVTGGTMSALASEIEKLAAYASGQKITRQDIDAVVEPVLDAAVFQMTDAVLEGNFGTALDKLRVLLQMQEKAIPLLAAMGSQFRRLLYASRMISAGQSEAAVAELLKTPNGKALPSFVIRKLMSAVRYVPAGYCEKAMDLCLEADLKLKSSTVDEGRVLELVVLELAQRAKA